MRLSSVVLDHLVGNLPSKSATPWYLSRNNKSCNYQECRVQFRQVKRTITNKNIKYVLC